MKTFLRIFAFLLVPFFASAGVAQNVRYDAPFPSVTSQFTTPFLVANTPTTGSPILAVCNSPANQVPCTNYATTYTSGGSACPNGAQDTPQPQPSACQSTGDAQGNIGFWAPAGKYDYTVCINISCFGPYTVTLGNSSATVVTWGTVLPVLPSVTGATTLTFLQQFPSTFNILDFGADPLGIADSTLAIQAALNYGGSVQQTMNCPPGVYLVSSLVLTTSHTGTGIIGPAKSQSLSLGCVFKSSGTGPLITTSTNHGVSNFEVANVTFNGNALATVGIFCDSCINWKIHDSDFQNFPANAVHIKMGGALYAREWNDVHSGLGYARDLQSGYSSVGGGGTYGCNDCWFWQNNISSDLGARNSGIIHSIGEDFEMTLDSPAVAAIDFSDTTTGNGVSSFYVDHGYFEMPLGGTATRQGVLGYAGNTNCNATNNDFFAPGQSGGAINTTLGTAVTVGNTPTSVMVTPAAMTNISNGELLTIDSNGLGGIAEQVVVTGITGTTFTAVFVNNHTSAATVQKGPASPGTIAVNFDNSYCLGGSVRGNSFRDWQTAVKLGTASSNGNTDVSGNYFERGTLTTSVTPLTSTATQTVLNSGTGSWTLATEFGTLFLNRAISGSAVQLQSTDAVINLAIGNNFWENTPTPVTITGVMNSQAGRWFTINNAGTNGGNVTLTNSVFHLCAGANYALSAGQALYFVVDAQNVVREVGIGSCQQSYPQVYEAGVLTTSEKIYTGTKALSTGAATLTFANSFTFTSSATFGCNCTDQTAANACQAVPASGSTVTLAGTASDVLWVSCSGH